MKNKIALLIAFLISGTILYGQAKSTVNVQQVWLAYLNQTRFSDKWGMWFDAHLRTKEEFFTDFSQSITRVGLTYYLNDATKLTAGYAYINHFPADNHGEISRPEHRPWQQIQWHTKYGSQRMMQYIRLEERYRRKILNESTLAEGHNFNYRLRYNLFYEVPLSKKGIQPRTWSFIVNDELHVNFGKEVVNNYFDQNRFFLGFKYQVNAHDNLQVGYMYLFQQLAGSGRYRNIHAPRISYLHNVDLRRKKG